VQLGVRDPCEVSAKKILVACCDANTAIYRSTYTGTPSTEHRDAMTDAYSMGREQVNAVDWIRGSEAVE
jgi:hypothetical protein